MELIGGTTEAFELVSASLEAGKPVVTGNKALLAERGAGYSPGAPASTPVYFEAAVAGGIPIISCRSLLLRTGLTSSRVLLTEPLTAF